MLQCIWSWLTSEKGLVPWAEYNQGLISVLALIAALYVAVVEWKRALKAEARATLVAREAKIQADAEAAEAKLKERLAEAHEFAVAVRRVLMDVEHELQSDRRAAKAFLAPETTRPLGVTLMAPDEKVRMSARASADTLNALLRAAPLSPGLIRATRDGAAGLLAVGSETAVTVHDVDETYASWIQALEAARMAIDEAELEFVHRLRPGLSRAMDFSAELG